jgi:DegV family protein with EDD domain
VVVVTRDSKVKIHLHTDDRDSVRDRLSALGHIVSWSEENITGQAVQTRRTPAAGTVHVMTDAAGSVTRTDAETLGLTLLDSYLVFDDASVPETLCEPARLYGTMGGGQRVTTAQASVFERHQAYGSVLARHEQVVYLCVGSVFTGNYDTAVQWKQASDPGNRFRIVDTGAASGRLGLIALRVADYAEQTRDIDAVVDFAGKLVDNCREFIFLDCLKYLAAGGRLSKTSGFFGDLLRMKPVISPTPSGVVKAGVVRNREGQVRFALEKLDDHLNPGSPAHVMLEYSDNRDWVENTVLPEISRRFPLARIRLQPLSLTSGAHMGPGTWGIAFLPE